jgi:hypothetical protein
MAEDERKLRGVFMPQPKTPPLPPAAERNKPPRTTKSAMTEDLPK